MATSGSELQEELEVLQAIYPNELCLETDSNASGRCSSITLQLHPATGERVDQQYVCLTLCFAFTSQYPSCAPGISISNPRGLDENHVVQLRDSLCEMAADRRGEAMLYELIEYAKECLTEGNTPHGHCVICRDPLDDGNALTRTVCYHHFHANCLRRYVEHALAEVKERCQQPKGAQPLKPAAEPGIICPVCREPIEVDLAALRQSASQHPCKTEPTKAYKTEPTKAYKPNRQMKEMQRHMAMLFEKQKQKGGIIDLDEEKNRFLLPAVDPSVSSRVKPVVYTDWSDSVQVAPAFEDRSLRKGFCGNRKEAQRVAARSRGMIQDGGRQGQWIQEEGPSRPQRIGGQPDGNPCRSAGQRDGENNAATTEYRDPDRIKSMNSAEIRAQPCSADMRQIEATVEPGDKRSGPKSKIYTHTSSQSHRNYRNSSQSPRKDAVQQDRSTKQRDENKQSRPTARKKYGPVGYQRKETALAKTEDMCGNTVISQTASSNPAKPRTVRPPPGFAVQCKSEPSVSEH